MDDQDNPAPETGVPKKEPKPARGSWLGPEHSIHVRQVPPGAININVDGRKKAGALQGFGQLWQKTYQVRLPGVELPAAQIMKLWQDNFARFQPKESRFYPPMTGIKPGEVLFIEGLVPAIPGSKGILPMSSGVQVIYVDDEQFTIMTPEGFPEAGWNTFSVFEADGLKTAQVQSLARAADPVYELFLKYLGSGEWQEGVWHHVLSQLAEALGVNEQVVMHKVCLDEKVQWRYAGNVVKSAAMRTVLYKLAAPLRWIVKRGQNHA